MQLSLTFLGLALTAFATVKAQAASSKEVYNRGNIIQKRDLYWTTSDENNPKYSHAAVEAPSYLTYKVISNTTNSWVARAECVDYCDSVPGCVAANMYQEVGNPLLDHVFSEKSNRKCALYGEVPSQKQMTNRGGQQLYGSDSPANYIKNSALFVRLYLPDIFTPKQFTKSFGPLETASNTDSANDFLGKTSIDGHSADTCAELCLSRAPGKNGATCQFFNIYRESGWWQPTTYTCAFFSGRKDASTATVAGDEKLSISNSYGFNRLW